MVGIWQVRAIWRASTLSPIFSITSVGGPTTAGFGERIAKAEPSENGVGSHAHVIPASLTMAAKAAFSERNPYPG